MPVIEVGTTATVLASAASQPFDEKTVLADVYAYGAMWVSKSPDLTADAAATGGRPLVAGQGHWTHLERGQKLYGITASGTANAQVEVG